jgi:hypothetical protein
MKLQTFTCGNCGSHKVQSAEVTNNKPTHTCRDCGSITTNGHGEIDVPYPEYTILGAVVDSAKEFENLYNEKTGYPFGVNVDIEFRPESTYTSRCIYNVTEIHNLYESYTPSVALESDLHGTGWTPNLAQIQKITVTAAEKLHSGYYEE